MTTDLLKALEVALDACGKATPGEVTVYDANDGGGWPSRPLWCFANEEYESGEDYAFQGSVHYGGKEDADFIAASLNLLRTYGPALLDLVRRYQEAPKAHLYQQSKLCQDGSWEDGPLEIMFQSEEEVPEDFGQSVRLVREGGE